MSLSDGTPKQDYFKESMSRIIRIYFIACENGLWIKGIFTKRSVSLWASRPRLKKSLFKIYFINLIPQKYSRVYLVLKCHKYKSLPVKIQCRSSSKLFYDKIATSSFFKLQLYMLYCYLMSHFCLNNVSFK